MDVEGSAERELMIAELARLGWAHLPEDGRIDVAAGHLLEHLNGALGAADAQTFLVDMALKALLLGYEYGEHEINFVDLADGRLMEAYEDFALDARRVTKECLAHETDEDVRAALSELRSRVEGPP